MANAIGENGARRVRVALLVDGENVSHSLAGQMVSKALTQGDLAIMRVYGNAASIPGWDKAERFRLIHSGSGKNATDMLLTVEAMAMAYAGGVDCFCIASSDRDFSHLVLHLREKGHRVIGMGEAKADLAYRKAFAKWEELSNATAVAAAPEAQPSPLRPVDDSILRLLRSVTENDGWITLQQFGLRLSRDCGHQRKETGCADWARYFKARANQFEFAGKGHEQRARVRLT